MKEMKKKKLETKGWKVGSTQDFLGLSDEEYAYIELKLALSRSLKERRQEKGLTQEDLAKLMGSSQSRIAKMEAGDPSVSLDLLVRSLLELGASKEDMARSFAAGDERVSKQPKTTRRPRVLTGS